MSVFVQMISSTLPNILLPNLVLRCITTSRNACKRLVCYFQGQGLSKGSYDQTMTISTISSELLVLLLPNLVWWYIIISQKVWWSNGIVVQGEGHSKFQNVNECLSRWYLLNRWTVYYQTWYGYASLWARLSSKKIGLVSSRLRSQWRIIFSKYDFLMSSELLILLHLNLVWWHIIISWIVMWKDWIALSWSRSRSQKKVQNSSECSSGWYLLKCWMFCNQIWYGDASSCARVSCKKTGLLSSSSGS